MADRRGLKLRKCPRRDPGAIGYGTYELAYACPVDEHGEPDPHISDVWFAFRRTTTPNGRAPGPDWVCRDKQYRRTDEFGLTLDQIEAEMIRVDNSNDAPPWI
jgi:hypothetical protein